MTKQEKKNILFSERCKKITEKWKKWDSEIEGEKMREDQLELQEKVNEALEVELGNAMARYGDKFANKNEMEEALCREVLELKNECFNIALWSGKIDLSLEDNQKNMMSKIKEHAIKCAMEAIQVACVCTKWLEGDK